MLFHEIGNSDTAPHPPQLSLSHYTVSTSFVLSPLQMEDNWTLDLVFCVTSTTVAGWARRLAWNILGWLPNPRLAWFPSITLLSTHVCYPSSPMTSYATKSSYEFTETPKSSPKKAPKPETPSAAPETPTKSGALSCTSLLLFAPCSFRSLPHILTVYPPLVCSSTFDTQPSSHPSGDPSPQRPAKSRRKHAAA